MLLIGRPLVSCEQFSFSFQSHRVCGTDVLFVCQLEPRSSLLCRFADLRAREDLRRVFDALHGESGGTQSRRSVRADELPRRPGVQTAVRRVYLPSNALGISYTNLLSHPAHHGLYRDRESRRRDVPRRRWTSR